MLSTNSKSCAKTEPVDYRPVQRIICLLCRIFVAPAAYLRIHQGDCLLNGGVYSQIGGIKQVCIFGRLERGRGAVAVAFVALQYVSEYVVKTDIFAPPFHFLEAPHRPRLGRGGDEQFHVGIGGDDRADIASIQNGTRWLVGEILLPFV